MASVRRLGTSFRDVEMRGGSAAHLSKLPTIICSDWLRRARQHSLLPYEEGDHPRCAVGWGRRGILHYAAW